MTEERLKYLTENFRKNTLSTEECDELFDFYDLLDRLPAYTNRFTEEEKTVYGDTLFDKIEEKAHAPTKLIPQKKKSIRLFKYLSAAMVLLVCTFTLLTYLNKTNVKHDNAKVIHINGHQDIAIITMPDGKIVRIDTSQQEFIKDGIRVSRLKNNKWKYELNTKTGQGNKPISIHIPRGASQSIVLADGSEINLNAESSIVLASDFINNRVVQLQGDARFDVKHLSNIPFIVNTKHQTIKVLGTKFNISAYADDRFTKTVLFNGKVQLSFPNSGQTEYLNPGESCLLNNNTESYKKEIVDMDKLALLDAGFILFEKESLRQIFEQIQRQYDVKVFVDPSLKDLKFTGVVPKTADLITFLKALRESQTFNYKLEDKILSITK